MENKDYAIFYFFLGGGGVANKVYYGLCEIGEFGYLMKQPLSESLETPLDEIFYPWEKTWNGEFRWKWITVKWLQKYIRKIIFICLAHHVHQFWKFSSWTTKTQARHGSWINTDQFPLNEHWRHKLLVHRVWGQAPPGIFLDLNSLKSHSIGFQVIQTGYWPDFYLESVFTIKNTFVMKNLTTSVKR